MAIKLYTVCAPLTLAEQTINIYGSKVFFFLSSIHVLYSECDRGAARERKRERASGENSEKQAVERKEFSGELCLLYANNSIGKINGKKRFIYIEMLVYIMKG